MASLIRPGTTTGVYSRALIIGLFLCTFLIVQYWIWDGLMRYTVAETLMNYSFGFYRRSLIGNLLLPFSSKTVVLTLISLLYSVCLVVPLTLIKRELREISETWGVVFLVFVLCAPLGLLFYLKDARAIRKELFFYPLFYLLLLGWPSGRILKNGAVALFIGTCSLIHESFLFLFLPFLLCYLWLNNKLTVKELLAQLAVSAGVTLILLKAPGNSAYITHAFVEQYVALGFPETAFEDFIYFQALTTQENMAVSLQHFLSPMPFITLGMLIGQFALLYILPILLGVQITLRKPQALIFSVCAIVAGSFCLCLIGMDYGRWMAMAFSLSAVLTASQIDAVRRVTVGRSPFQYILVTVLVVLLALLIRVPYYLYRTDFVLSEWLELTDTFGKIGARVWH